MHSSPDIKQDYQSGAAASSPARTRLYLTDWSSRLLGTVLIIAFALKGYELATGPALETHFATSRSFLVLLVEYELALGFWLLSGICRNWARLAALASFVGFLELSLFQALSGQKSCGCFGTLVINPWLTVAFDFAAIASLLSWKTPSLGARSGSFHAWALAGLVGAFSVVGFAAFMSMTTYAGVMPALRRDPLLKKPIRLDPGNATMEQVLDRIQQATGVTLGVDRALHEKQPIFKDLKVSEIKAWSLMELVAARHSSSARWVKSENGYWLVPGPWYPRINPWLVGTLLVGVTPLIVLLGARYSIKGPWKLGFLSRSGVLANLGLGLGVAGALGFWTFRPCTAQPDRP